jgi:DNA-binding response OmpR family regulator
MPKMNGFELYQEIRKLDDNVKVCFITAFDVDHGEIKRELQNISNIIQLDKEGEGKEKLDVDCFIQKPIDIDVLVKRLREELDSWHQ